MAMNTAPTNLRPHLFGLTEQDAQALAVIRQHMRLNSNALAVRVAIRRFAKLLNERSQEAKKGN